MVVRSSEAPFSKAQVDAYWETMRDFAHPGEQNWEPLAAVIHARHGHEFSHNQNHTNSSTIRANLEAARRAETRVEEHKQSDLHRASDKV